MDKARSVVRRFMWRKGRMQESQQRMQVRGTNGHETCCAICDRTRMTASPAPTSQPQSISFDQVLTTMLQAADGVSDCLFVVGRPPQIEAYGKLRPVEIPGFMPSLQGPHTQAITAKLMGDNERLKHDFKESGSCDTSYAVPNVARFRVNIFLPSFASARS